MRTTTISRKKSRLRLALLAAVALGSSSATMSGVLTTLVAQQPVAGTTQFA
jgi:hypothetical protein